MRAGATGAAPAKPCVFVPQRLCALCYGCCCRKLGRLSELAAFRCHCHFRDMSLHVITGSSVINFASSAIRKWPGSTKGHGEAPRGHVRKNVKSEL